MGEIDAILSAAAACEARDEPYALATVVAVRGSSYRRPGARLLVPRDAQPVGIISGGCLEAEAAAHARDVLAAETPRLVTIHHSAEGDEVWGSGLGCRGVIDLLVEPADLAAETVGALRAAHETGAETFLLTGEDGERRRLSREQALGLGERAALAVARGRPTLIGQAVLDPILPSPHLLVCGAGPDAEPIVAGAVRLGWGVTVADPRRGAPDPARFPGATLVGGDPAEVAGVASTGRSAALLMSHNYLRDGEYLAALVGSGLDYIGILGPRDRTERLLAELARQGVQLTDDDRMHLHAPAGLDLGADGPEEVAAAILAEILAVFHGGTGLPLRERSG